MIRVVSLFCGIGNADAAVYDAAEELGVEVHVVAAVDLWPKAVEVYNANLPPVAQVADIKTLQRSDLPAHDLVIAGPPCQPFSVTGKRTGHDDPRSCLPDFLRLAAVNYLLHVLHQPSPHRFRDIRSTEGIPGRRLFYGKITPITDNDFLPTLTAQFWHGFDVRSAARLVDGIRCPSVEEGQRAHSIPDSWDWRGATKTQRGQMIANSWPRGLGKAVCKAMLSALIVDRLGRAL